MRGLTFRYIWEHTPPSRFASAANVVVRELKVGISKKLGVPKAIAQTWSKDPSKDGRPKMFKYSTMMEFYDEGKVKVSCSCADHLYRWEYALAKKNASYITYGNGDRPVDTNPKQVPGCCKHVIALYLELRKKKLLPK